MTKRPKSLLFNFGRNSGCALNILYAIILGASHATAATIPPVITPQQFAMYEQAPESDRVHFLIQMAKSGQHEQAALLLKRYPLQGAHATNRTLFIEGLIKSGRGDLTGAAKNYRMVLANHPNLTLVRSELAQTLVLLDQDDSAKHHLELLAADAPSDTEAAGIRSFIEKIDEKRPLTFNGYISIAPSTNLNGGSSHKTVYSPIFNADLDINPAQQKQSGVGAAVGTSVGYTRRLGNKIQAVVAANADGRVYKDLSADSLSFSESGELRYLIEHGYLGLGAVASQSIDPSQLKLSYNSFGPRFSLHYNITPQDRITASSVYEWRDYPDYSPQNGTAWMTNASLSHAFNSSFNATLFGGYDKVGAEVKAIGYTTYSGGMSFYKEMPLGITLNTSAQARVSKFDAVNIVTNKVREDQRYIGSLEITKRDLNWFGFAPSLSYSYTLNKSNIAFYDYDAHAVDFRLTKDF